MCTLRSPYNATKYESGTVDHRLTAPFLSSGDEMVVPVMEFEDVFCGFDAVVKLKAESGVINVARDTPQLAGKIACVQVDELVRTHPNSAVR
mmetsp:Transcript_15283/g.21274  ORF Transcript_15283/g.21274 Transcript_15283/m.21274 type:complete len:92 (+) Transcript_15283:67-342(+)